MKVIAEIPQRYGSSHLLVQLTAEELSIICHGRPNTQMVVRTGTEIELGKHWERVRAIEDAQEALNRAAKSIHSVADILGTIDVVIPPAEEVFP